MRTRLVTIALLMIGLALPAVAQEKAGPAKVASEGDNKEGVALTVYNGGYGVVREFRSLDIPQNGSVKFTDVASQIDPTTVHFRSITDPAAKLLEQNYQYDLVSAERLLYKYIDKHIDVVAKEKTYSGTLLSYDGGQIVLQDKDGGIAMIQRADNVRDIRFGELPGGLLTRPTLLWLVSSEKAGKQLAEVSYQTGGINWHAEYVMVLTDGDSAADLTGWVSVDNKSGKAYKDAKLKFIAGDVRKIIDDPGRPVPSETRSRRNEKSEAPMTEKAFFEYHMYSLPRPSTVADNEVKQLEMFSPVQGLKIEKKYLYDPSKQFRFYGGVSQDRAYGVTSDKKVQVFVEFKNSQENKLGMPLPAGKIRVYKQDPADKAMEFIGEEKIDHTPKDENLSLQIGNAFDIVGERKQTDFKVETGRHWMSETFEIKVRNHKKEAVTVRVKEPLYRWSNWKIVEKSNEFTKLDSQTVAFDVPVAADKETVVTYTVEYTW